MWHCVPHQFPHGKRWLHDSALDDAGGDAGDAIGLAAIVAEREFVKVGLQVPGFMAIACVPINQRFNSDVAKWQACTQSAERFSALAQMTASCARSPSLLRYSRRGRRR